MAQKKDDEKTGGPPLEHRKVKVDAHPRSSDGKRTPAAGPYAGKVDRALKKDIEEKMDAANPDVDSQIDAAKEAVAESKDKVDEGLVDMVTVEVTGEVDGNEVEYDLSFFPGKDDDDDDP